MKYSTVLAEVEIPPEVKGVEATSLYRRLQGISDQRKRRGKRYSAAVVLTLLLLAKLAGETELGGMAEWVSLRRKTLAGQLPLWKGQTPCANTYRYVCAHVDVEELTAVVGQYFGELTGGAAREATGAGQPQAATSIKPVPQTHLALDGKSLRGTRRRGEAIKSAAHALGLYNVTHAYMWKQQAFAGKGQERQAALALIAALDLRHTVVSADALHTQPRWARTILDCGGDYLLIAKRNQSELRTAIALLFSQPPRPLLFPEQEARTVDKAHGRREIRHLRVSCELSDYLAPRWPQVAQVFQVERTVTCQGKTTCERAYGLTSLTAQQASPHHLLALVRHHWHIENRNHWRRDVTLGEDACRVTVAHVPLIFAALNNTVLALVDALHQPNLAAACRYFNAEPLKALALLRLPVAQLSSLFV